MNRELLLIADIGGYTRFMRDQVKALAHAQVVVGKLLEALIDSSRPFSVEKLEGDAVFLHLPWPEAAEAPEIFPTVQAMHRAFTGKQAMLEAARTCDCDSCAQMHALRVKFVANAGEAVRQKIGPFSELTGLEVILTHRMLKNKVPAPEYLLGTSPVLPLMGGAPPGIPLEHDFDGIGPTKTYFRKLPAEARDGLHRSASLPEKMAVRAMLEFGTLLLDLGLKPRIDIKQK